MTPPIGSHGTDSTFITSFKVLHFSKIELKLTLLNSAAGESTLTYFPTGRNEDNFDI